MKLERLIKRQTAGQVIVIKIGAEIAHRWSNDGLTDAAELFNDYLSGLIASIKRRSGLFIVPSDWTSKQ